MPDPASAPGEALSPPGEALSPEMERHLTDLKNHMMRLQMQVQLLCEQQSQALNLLLHPLQDAPKASEKKKEKEPELPVKEMNQAMQDLLVELRNVKVAPGGQTVQVTQVVQQPGG